MSFYFGNFHEPFLTVPHNVTLHKIFNKKYGFQNDNLDRRGKYLANHPQHIKKQEICTRLRLLNKMFDLEVEALRKHQHVRKHYLYERKEQHKLKNYEILARDYRQKKAEHDREKFKIDRLKRQEDALKRRCNDVKDENHVREMVQEKLDKSGRLVKHLQDVKKQADVGVLRVKQRLKNKKQELSQEVEYSKKLELLTMRECHKQMTQADQMLEELKQVNNCLKVYNEKLDRYAKVVQHRRCRDLTYKIQDIQHIPLNYRKLNFIGPITILE